MSASRKTKGINISRNFRFGPSGLTPEGWKSHFFTNASGGLIVNLYRSSASFIHLLGGVGIEVGHRERVANPFRGDVLQLRTDDREYGREQKAPVSPNKDEIAHIADWQGRG